MFDNAMAVKTFTIKPKEEGKSTKNSYGLTDNRLFKGGNKLHAIQDAATCLWTLKYEVGALPQGLKGVQFTRIRELEAHVQRYFDKRGLLASVEEPSGNKSSHG